MPRATTIGRVRGQIVRIMNIALVPSRLCRLEVECIMLVGIEETQLILVTCRKDFLIPFYMYLVYTWCDILSNLIEQSLNASHAISICRALYAFLSIVKIRP